MPANPPRSISQTLRGPGSVGEDEGRAGGNDRESNWLSAPADRFILMLRLYWPKKAIIKGEWKPPAVKQVQ